MNLIASQRGHQLRLVEPCKMVRGLISPVSQDLGLAQFHRTSSRSFAQAWLTELNVDAVLVSSDDSGKSQGLLPLIRMRNCRRDASIPVIALVPSNDHPTRDALLAERLRRRVEPHVDAEVGQVTLSPALPTLTSNTTVSDLISRPGQALYSANHGGRNSTSVAPSTPAKTACGSNPLSDSNQRKLSPLKVQSFSQLYIPVTKKQGVRYELECYRPSHACAVHLE